MGHRYHQGLAGVQILGTTPPIGQAVEIVTHTSDGVGIIIRLILDVNLEHCHPPTNGILFRVGHDEYALDVFGVRTPGFYDLRTVDNWRKFRCELTLRPTGPRTRIQFGHYRSEVFLVVDWESQPPSLSLTTFPEKTQPVPHVARRGPEPLTLPITVIENRFLDPDPSLSDTRLAITKVAKEVDPDKKIFILTFDLIVEDAPECEFDYYLKGEWVVGGLRRVGQARIPRQVLSVRLAGFENDPLSDTVVDGITIHTGATDTTFYYDVYYDRIDPAPQVDSAFSGRDQYRRYLLDTVYADEESDARLFMELYRKDRPQALTLYETKKQKPQKGRHLRRAFIYRAKRRMRLDSGVKIDLQR